MLPVSANSHIMAHEGILDLQPHMDIPHSNKVVRVSVIDKYEHLYFLILKWTFV